MIKRKTFFRPILYLLTIFSLLPPLFSFSSDYGSDLQNPCFSEKKKKRHQHHELALVAIFRDEARFLQEWVEYYRLQGVSRFYLFNNLSQDNYTAVLMPYIKKGIVRLFDWNIPSKNNGYWNHVQVAAYTQGMRYARKDKVTWLIVADTDEFFVPVRHNTLADLVQEYDKSDAGALMGKWIMFGTSGVKEIPSDKLLIETLLCNGGREYCIGEKSILHTQRADIDDPHEGKMLASYRKVHLPYELLQVNHYWSRDEKFFYNVKIPRRKLWGMSRASSEDFINKFNSPDKIDETLPILRFVDSLQKALKK